jgi:hypothetical protein
MISLLADACRADLGNSLRGARPPTNASLFASRSLSEEPRNYEPWKSIPSAPDYGDDADGSCGSLSRIVPAWCGSSPWGSAVGKASGLYCAATCLQDSDCPKGTSDSTPKCTMNQGDGKKYCEYTCETDDDCPYQATCEFNIASKVCTYNCVGVGGDCTSRNNLCCPAAGAWMGCTKGFGGSPGWSCISG